MTMNCGQYEVINLASSIKKAANFLYKFSLFLDSDKYISYLRPD